MKNFFGIKLSEKQQRVFHHNLMDWKNGRAECKTDYVVESGSDFLNAKSQWVENGNPGITVQRMVVKISEELEALVSVQTCMYGDRGDTIPCENIMVIAVDQIGNLEI